MTATEADLTAADISWDLEPLVNGQGERGMDAMLEAAAEFATNLGAYRGRIATLSPSGLAEVMTALATIEELVGRASSYAALRYSIDTADPALGAALQRVEERATAIGNLVLFFDLEWAEIDDASVARLLADDELAFCRHYLASARRYRPHLLSEAEELVLSEKSVTGRSAWARLFGELNAAIRVELDGEDSSLEEGLSLLASPDRSVRKDAADAVTRGLEPGLRTRAFVFNTLLADKALDDRLRSYPHWLASMNLANQAGDASVQALVDAVRGNYDIPQRWYALKAKLLGLDRLADYDRSAAIAQDDTAIGWDEARKLVLDAYGSFSDELASMATRFFEENWIDAPVRPNKSGGAFCAYTTPSQHPYLLLNWTSRRRDVLTLAHELGHGLHGYLARGQGVFHQSTPLTLAETASVFGETITFGRLLSQTTDPEARLALVAANLEDQIATVFRQTAMNRFEALVHNARRTSGELSVADFGDFWVASQAEMLGDAVEITEGYRSWWSYIPHFVNVPGYVYAYAYGQLLALSVYRRYEQEGPEFVGRYLELLSLGGSRSPEDLGRVVGVNLDDPTFWDGGLSIVRERLEIAEEAAASAMSVSALPTGDSGQ